MCPEFPGLTDNHIFWTAQPISCFPGPETVPAASSCRCLRPQCWDLMPEAGESQVQILLLGRELASGARVCFLAFPVSSSIQVLHGIPHSHSPWQTLGIPPILSLWDRCTTVTEGKTPAWIPSSTCLKLYYSGPGPEARRPHEPDVLKFKSQPVQSPCRKGVMT